MAFRDDRDALLARLSALEQELAAARRQSSQKDFLRELESLSRQVQTASSELQADQSILQEIAAGIERLHHRAVGEEAEGKEVPEVDGAASKKSPVIIALIITALLLLAMFSLCILAPKTEEESRTLAAQAALTTNLLPEVSGFPHAVDPVQALKQVKREVATRKQAPMHLLEMTAYLVKTNGLVDLDNPSYPNANISYTFCYASKGDERREEPRAPMGVPTPPKPSPYRKSEARIDNRGVVLKDENVFLDVLVLGGCDRSSCVPPPRCSLRQVWQRVIHTHKLPDDAVAVVEYKRSLLQDGAGWDFTILGTSIQAALPAGFCEQR